MPRKLSGLWKSERAVVLFIPVIATHHAQETIWALEARPGAYSGYDKEPHHARCYLRALKVERRCRSLTAHLDNHAQDTTWALKSEWRSRLANVKGCIIMSGLSRALKVPEISYPHGAEDR